MNAAREKLLLQHFTMLVAGIAAKVGAPTFPGLGTDAQVEAWVHDVARRVESLAHERRLMAMLAAPAPQFFNPLTVWEAEAIRDRILLEGDA